MADNDNSGSKKVDPADIKALANAFAKEVGGSDKDRSDGMVRTQVGEFANKMEKSAIGLEKIAQMLQSFGHQGFQSAAKPDVAGLTDAAIKRVDQIMASADNKMSRKEVVAQQVEWATKEIANKQASYNRNQSADAFLGVSDAVSKLSSTIKNEFMFGGLLGFLFHGVKKESEWRATSQKIAQVFDDAGGQTDKIAAKVQGFARDLSSNMLATVEDIAAVSKALADVGEKKAELFNSSRDGKNEWGGVFGKDSALAEMGVVETLISLDKQFETSAGTFAKYAGTMKRDFGSSIEDATAKLAEYASAAKGAGMSGSFFVQSVLQNASALRTMGDQTSFVADMQIGLADSLSKMTNTDVGRWSGFVTKGAGEVTSALASMDEGRAAYFGELAGFNQGGSPLETSFNYKTMGRFMPGGETEEGRRENMERGLRPIAIELKGLVGEGASLADKAGHIGKILPGLSGPEGQVAMVHILEKLESGQKLSADDMKAISKALDKEGAKTDEFTRLMTIIKDALANVAVGLLSTIVSGLMELKALVKYAYESRPGGSQHKADLAWAEMLFYSKVNEDNMNMMSKQVSRMVKDGGELVESALGGAIKLFKAKEEANQTLPIGHTSTGNSRTDQGNIDIERLKWAISENQKIIDSKDPEVTQREKDEAAARNAKNQIDLDRLLNALENQTSAVTRLTRQFEHQKT